MSDPTPRRQLDEHREVWRRKAVLADVYRVWFDALLETAGPSAKILEVGAGPGFLASYTRSRRPDIRWIASDLVETGWNDVVADALQLPFRARSLDAVMGLDLVHHLARPAAFFAEVARALKPGGHLCVIEPWVTPLSYPVYRWLHHEGCTLDLDPWDPFGVAESTGKEPFRGDNACAWRLVRQTPSSRWEEMGLRPPRLTLLNGFAYLCSLGFRSRSLLPRSLAPLLISLDRRASALAPYTGMRALLTWEVGN